MFATLIRLLGDFDVAEEALHDAFRAALEQWPREGVPANPRAWLVSAGRFKAIDGIRRRARFDSLEDRVDEVEAIADEASPWATKSVEDDRLRLIFTCCHPALAPDAQVALTLREVCGLTTEEIAQAFLTRRADARAAHRAGEGQDPRRAHSVSGADAGGAARAARRVLRVIYLVFNEGYSASSGQSVTRVDLSGEAIRLGRLLVELLPEPEAIGLLALMLLHESRRAARATPSGELVLLDDQDRSLWNRDADRAKASALVTRALASRTRIGPYALQAAIAAVHAEAATAAATDWNEIVGLYDVLLRADPSPVIELNRAVAVAMRDGPAAGLALIDAILARGDLARLPPRPRGAGRPVPAARHDRRRPRVVPSARSRWPGRSPSGGSSNSGSPTCRADRRHASVHFGRARKYFSDGCRFAPPPIDQPMDSTPEDPMKFLCLICAEPPKQMSEAEARKRFAEYTEFTDAIRTSGHYVGCNRLQPPDTAVTVRVRDGKVSTTDGPFVETKEQLGGYYLIEARDMERSGSHRLADTRGADRLRRSAPGCRRPADPAVARPRRRERRAIAARAPTRHPFAATTLLLGHVDFAPARSTNQ